MLTFCSQWFTIVWILFAYFLVALLGILASSVLFFGIVLGLRLVQASLIVITGNAVIRQVFEAYYQGQIPPESGPIFLSPADAAIIGAIGAPIASLATVATKATCSLLTDDDDDEDDCFLAYALRRVSLQLLLSLVFGVTMGAIIFRLKNQAISVGYSALCAWAGVVVLVIPLALFDAFLQSVVMEVLVTTYSFVVGIFIKRIEKGQEICIAGEGSVALPI